jgi:nondiscriminating glutamyl-tRNA synthetase
MRLESNKRRLRFAPSPTGRLHVGSARTALYNWLLARHHDGVLVLRIEDTDAERSTRDMEERLMADLHWMGLQWNEGPDVGGPHGPYRQSERTAVYAARARQLLEADRAFRCFCSDELLATKREAQRAAGEEPHYDGTCRRLDPGEAGRRAQSGEAHTIRFHVRGGVVRFEDLVRGPMEIDSATLGDFVLLRSNGLPTYNFACVVDDAEMHISHVVRGDDHLYNTARQVMLYAALEIAAPEFAHLALILDEDRSKLSKREGREGTYVNEYRDAGFLPAALVNFLALLGWSSPSGDDILDLERLVQEFDLDRVSKSPAIFDARKLRWMAGEHLRALPIEELAERARPFLRAAGLPDEPERAAVWTAAFKDGIASLGELPPRVRELLHPGPLDAEAATVLDQEEARRLLDIVADRLERVPGDTPPMDGAQFKELLQECGRELGVRGKSLFMPARVALTGRLHGPELALLFDAIGRETATKRIRDAAR